MSQNNLKSRLNKLKRGLIDLKPGAGLLFEASSK
jgi:hypothetical protein